MGAGLSGLACAAMLEKLGLQPTIFEKRCQVGDRFVNGEVLLAILSKPIHDAIAYLGDTYGIYLQPSSYIRNLVLYSEHYQATLSGHLGFCNLRGRDPQSFENQLARQIKSEIVFNSPYSYEQLLGDFTHVVMATGDAAYVTKMRNYQIDAATTLNGYTITGEFDRYTIRAWLDQRLAPHGYGYLIPLSDKVANIVLWRPVSPGNLFQEQELPLEIFHRQVCRTLDQTFTITGHFEIHDYLVGICCYPRIGNTFFTGNCFGAITPYLGFGQWTAILTGIYAALDITGGRRYSELTQALRQNYHNSLVLRRVWEQFSNGDFDRMVKCFSSFWGNKLFNARWDVVQLASYLARPWVKLRQYREE